MKNKVGTEIRVITPEELKKMVAPGLWETVVNLRNNQGTHATLVFENLDLGIICRRGLERSFLAAGPGRSYSVEQAAGGVLGSTPSTFRYPVAICYTDHAPRPTPV